MSATLTKPLIALSSQESAGSGYTHMVILRQEDLTNTSTSGTPTQTIQVIDLAVGDVIHNCAAYVAEKFANSGDSGQNSTTLEVGDDGNAARFLASMELNANGTTILAKAGTSTQLAYVVADTLDLKITGTASKALSALDLGEVHVFFRIAKLGKLAKAFNAASI